MQSVNYLNSYIVWLSLYCCTICTVSNVSLIFEIVRHIISEDTSNVTCLLHETIPLIVPYPTTHTLNIIKLPMVDITTNSFRYTLH